LAKSNQEFDYLIHPAKAGGNSWLPFKIQSHSISEE